MVEREEEGLEAVQGEAAGVAAEVADRDNEVNTEAGDKEEKEAEEDEEDEEKDEGEDGKDVEEEVVDSEPVEEGVARTSDGANGGPSNCGEAEDPASRAELGRLRLNRSDADSEPTWASAVLAASGS